MYCTGRRCSALLPILPSGQSKKFCCDPRSIFTINHHYNSDIRITVDRTPPTANKVNSECFIKSQSMDVFHLKNFSSTAYIWGRVSQEHIKGKKYTYCPCLLHCLRDIHPLIHYLYCFSCSQLLLLIDNCHTVSSLIK